MSRATPGGEIEPIYLRIAPADIAYLKFVFEAYEEVGIVRTVERHTAVIVILAMRDFVDVARAILAGIGGQIDCAEIDKPAGDGDDWLMREI